MPVTKFNDSSDNVFGELIKAYNKTAFVMEPISTFNVFKNFEGGQLSCDSQGNFTCLILLLNYKK